MPAGTNYLWRPGLKGRICGSLVPDGVASVYESFLNANDDTSIQNAMRTGIDAAAETGTVMYTGASNSDGKPGQYRLFLYDLFRKSVARTPYGSAERKGSPVQAGVCRN